MTPKQERFIAEYLIDLNATQAAMRAGVKREASAAVQGSKWLRNPNISAEIARKRAELQRITQWDSTQILIRLGDYADADFADIVDEKGNYRPIGEWPKVWRRMLQGCDVEETFTRSKDGKEASWDKTGQVVKIKFIDRLKNLELLGRHANINAFALPVEKHEHVHIHLELESRLVEAREIAAKVIE